MNDTKTLAELSREWQIAKHAEAHATTQRIAVEKKILAITGTKPSGNLSKRDGIFKIVVTTNVGYSMDWKAWDKLSKQIPVELHPIKQKPEIDPRGVKWLMTNRPDLYRVLAQALTKKINKPSIAISEEKAT